MNIDSPSSQKTNTLLTLPDDAGRISILCGPMNRHLKQIEQGLAVEIHQRGNHFTLEGSAHTQNVTRQVLQKLYEITEDNTELKPEMIHLYLKETGEPLFNEVADYGPEIKIKTKSGLIRPRGENQNHYLQNIYRYDINFGIGPAGTGKTYLAVACAVDALQKEEIRRILLVRPAVEAGEKLGFLPGDLAEKINPYLRPLYDALYEMLGFDKVNKLLEKQIIEVAPLAYMRGRTLNNSFIILDESQNTTPEQMKMFLTRIGFGSKAVITGDITQTDLPRGTQSGLRHATRVLDEVEQIGFTFFKAKDVVRHNLVQRIVEAYDHDDQVQNEADKNRGR